MMTNEQKREYKRYRKECRLSNVEPVLADFLAGDIPSCVTYQMELDQNELEWRRQKLARAACAGV